MNQQTTEAASIQTVSHWYTDDKEEVYFTVAVTLPRVGLVETRFTADRYKASTWSNDKPQGLQWTNWRVIRDTSKSLPGVGPKTLDLLRDKVVPMVMAWLASAAYGESVSKEIARFIARTATENRYNLDHAKRLLVKHVNNISLVDYERIMRGINLLEEGYAALNG